MSVTELKSRITEDVKSAMRSGDKPRLATLRLVQAAIKQIEVDTRETLDDAGVLGVLEKMVKQRRESISQYGQAGRDDLVAVEEAELAIIQTYMPEALSEAEIQALVDAALAESGASSVRDMGKVMTLLKPQMQGRADMAMVSGMVKARLN
ncbi:hypothetical protein SAMN05216526_0914 [Ectothiorhodosinus mongolicus]|uniref:Glutamyl-tRNA amidotransferase n=1 Tax=Ectothiorhodosinus mongolicus TaxID=233100 RepID=A0A1R3VUW2_9GAMM|nr:GatB/YqeY domain-containing protein [Ectothiorhodosinus mongolicus]ULX56863.1 glutamyl-tRNA amidotransferase [Ectothiorhodosinus mongolicus]SIT68709.1 hypothetical protein SAMN05216526_0914 [Ectothiorhodosinus mongolicus]